MAFRKYGGLSYAPNHNIVKTHYANSDNVVITENFGLGATGTKMMNRSDFDMNGNNIINVDSLSFADGSSQNSSAALPHGSTFSDYLFWDNSIESWTVGTGTSVHIGSNALLNSTSSVGENTAVGNNACANLTTGSNVTCIGYNSQPSSGSATNEITLGNNGITVLRCSATSITSTSDARDKTDIEPLTVGLQFIKNLCPVNFVWNMRDGSKVGGNDCGFLAQDLMLAQKIEELEASYGKLIPVLVKAIQDLSLELDVVKGQLQKMNDK